MLLLAGHNFAQIGSLLIGHSLLGLPSINITAAPVVAGTSDASGNVTVTSLGTSDTVGVSVSREWVRGFTVVGAYPTAYTKTEADAGFNIRLREVWSATGFRDTTSYSNAISVDALVLGAFSSAFSSAFDIAA